jgi:tetraacyldisaccharide 4'-kinase
MRFFKSTFFALLLWPLSLLYGFFIELRNIFYALKIFKTHRVSCRIISVGNITVGGTGKTPTVIWLADYLTKRKKSVCILSRGYHRTTKHALVVSDQHGIYATVEECGDEPFLIARRLKGIPVVVDFDRVRGAQLAIKKFNPDVIILDDGFQHRRLYRDLDIVTMPHPKPFGNGFLLPAGPMREFKHHLNRAGALWMNAAGSTPAAEFSELSSWPKIVRIRAHYQATCLEDSQGKRHNPDLRQIPIVAICALGNPDGFYKSLTDLGAAIKEFIAYPDHYWYSRKDINSIQHKLQEHHARLLITTEKDWVKLSSLCPLNSQWRYLVIEIVPEDDEIILKVLGKSGILQDL